MKKTLHLFLAAFITVSVIAQPVNKKARNGFNLKKTSRESLSMSVRLGYSNLNQLKSSSSGKMQLDSIVSKTWDNNDNQWVISEKEFYTYDESGKNITGINSHWDPSINQWVYSDKSEFTYYPNGNINEHISSYKENDSLWTLASKEQLIYNSDGSRKLYLGFDWNENTSSWDTSYKGDFHIESLMNRTIQIGYQLNELTNKWDTMSKNIIYSDEFGHDTLQLVYFHDELADSLVCQMKFELVYDSNGKNTSQIMYSIRDTSKLLVPLSKSEFTFDEFNNWEEIIGYEWNNSDSVWEFDSKSKITYDYSYSKDDFVLPYFYSSYNFNNMLFQSVSYNYIGDGWGKDDDLTTFYFSVPLTITNINSNQAIQKVTVFPNPASDYIKINLGSESGYIELFDLQGRKVLNHELLDETTISIQQLNNGLYFYRIESSNGLSTGKLIIKK